MSLEKKIAKLKVDTLHVGGWFMIGTSLAILVSLKGIESPFTLFLNFLLFLTLFLLGLSYLGEKHD